jgi:hypothetical protein
VTLLITLNLRCSDMERQLSNLRDLEDGGGHDLYDGSGGGLGAAGDEDDGSAGAATGRYSGAGRVAATSGASLDVLLTRYDCDAALQRRSGGGGAGGSLAGRPRDNKVLRALWQHSRSIHTNGAALTHKLQHELRR